MEGRPKRKFETAHQPLGGERNVKKRIEIDACLALSELAADTSSSSTSPSKVGDICSGSDNGRTNIAHPVTTQVLEVGDICSTTEHEVEQISPAAAESCNENFPSIQCDCRLTVKWLVRWSMEQERIRIQREHDMFLERSETIANMHRELVNFLTNITSMVYNQIHRCRESIIAES